MYILHLALKMHQKYSMAYSLTYLALITMYMFCICFSSVFFLSVFFSYTVLCELRLFIVSEFGFGVWNRTTAPATMEYLPILLGKYLGIYFLVNTRVFRFLRKYSSIYFAPKYKPFYLLAYSFYVNPNWEGLNR